MIFSTDNLIRQENVINNAPINKSVITITESTSIFMDALRYILEENILIENELSRVTKENFKNKQLAIFNEANPITAVGNFFKNGININLNLRKDKNPNTPGLLAKIKNAFTIENIVKFIVTAFIKIVTRLFREFEILCMNLVSKSSQIKRLHEKIYDIGVKVPYELPIFTYTHIIEENNKADFEQQLDSIYDELTSFVDSFKSLSPSEVETAINEFRSSRMEDEEYYSTIRGNLLGLNTLIHEDKFNEALFRYFRNGSSEASVVNYISPEDIRARLERYDIAPKIIKRYTKDKDKLQKGADKLVSKLSASKIDKYLDEVPVYLVELYSDLVNRYCNKIRNTCNIFVLYYGHRLDAAKDELMTNTKILFRAAQLIVREG